MKFSSLNFRNLALSLGLCFAHSVWSVPAIQSIEVSPNPLITGQNFSLAVAGSPDVVKAVARVDFHTAQPRSVLVPLIQQGSTWVGNGLAPADVQVPLPNGAGALVKVALFDAAGRRIEGVLQVGVHVESITAVLTNGVLAITGDDQDNTIIASRDAAGNILVNGGAVPVIGGAPTVGSTSLIIMIGNDGNDTLTVNDSNGLMPPAHLLGGEGDDTLTGSASADVLEGGAGNDTLLGRGGDDTLMGGDGNDILNGGQGTDLMVGGAGDDQSLWSPGDGSDVVEGDEGGDTLVFFGANISETVDISANGPRLRFFRNIGNITMDCDGIEQVVFHALGGADQVTVNDLTGTQVKDVTVNLLSSTGTNDGQADTVFVKGTGTNDIISVVGSTNGVTVLGLAATVTVIGGEDDLDRLVVDALAGDDIVDASHVQAGAIALTLNGGDGNDTLIGGDGNDLINGGRGADVMIGGPGSDTFPWLPGEGSDVVEGGTGVDTMLFDGANIVENVDISANGQRLRFFRNIGTVVMDCNQVEVIQYNARGGGDTVNINDLTGTGVTQINLNLENVPGSGQGNNAADNIIITGTTNNDVVTIAGITNVSVVGLSAAVNIVGSEPTLDQLTLKMLAGDDVATAADLQAGLIKLTIDGGPGDDVITGSHGDDSLFGDLGDDILNGGPGLDLLDGGPGNNVLIQ